MAEFYIRLIKREHEGPYSLGGWSFGGLVAYEMARQFVINGEKVDNVLLIDTITPSNILMYQQQSQEHQGGFKFRSNPQVEYGLNEFSDFYEILHHNIEQCEAKIKRYKIKKYDHNVVLLRGIPKDTEVKFLYSDDYGWKSLAKKLKIFDIPGEHQKLFDVEYIKSTAECIKNCLADVEKILL
jgi:thioesterase domain-containing protein